jgi:hypothetical protein
VQGSDVSINDAMKAGAAAQDIASGNVVTVHSGTARLQLAAGGEVSICGPAKFTVLDSGGGEVTLALEFGRMQLDLPPAALLRVLTPAIVARPLEIDRGKRNMTIGLDQDDSLCVLATSGAVQLEQEFSGERLIVPESGDFFLQSGQLVPVADTGQSCKCAPAPQMTQPSQYPAPESATIVPPTAATPAAAPTDNLPEPAMQGESSVQVAVLSGANEEHPSLTSEKQAPVAAPPDEAQASYKIIVPPLVFSPGSPAPPGEAPTPETALLIREVHADPDWQFTGHVDSPGFAQAMSSALGESGPGSKASTTATSASQKKRGFWSSVKRLFGGS